MKMTMLVACCSVLYLAIPATAHAQANPFTGKWKVNAAKSTGEVAKEEFLILENTNETEHAINDILNKEGVHTRGEYTAHYNDGKWYPGKSLDTGKPTGQNLLIRLTPRSEIRLGKTGGEDVSSTSEAKGDFANAEKPMKR